MANNHINKDEISHDDISFSCSQYQIHFFTSAQRQVTSTKLLISQTCQSSSIGWYNNFIWFSNVYWWQIQSANSDTKCIYILNYHVIIKQSARSKPKQVGSYTSRTCSYLYSNSIHNNHSGGFPYTGVRTTHPVRPRLNPAHNLMVEDAKTVKYCMFYP